MSVNVIKQRQRRHRQFQRQKGFTLIEITVALIIMSIVAIQIGDQVYREYLETLADEQAAYMAQYNHAVRSYVSDQGLLTVPGNYTGVSWLQSAGCPGGTAAKDYFPCAMPSTLQLGLTYSTSITVGADVIATTTFGAVSIDGSPDGSLAGRITRKANGHRIQGAQPEDATFTSFSYDPLTAIVTSLVSNAPSADAWLRTDGSNSMNAALDMNNNSIQNVLDMTFGDGQTQITNPAPGTLRIENGVAGGATLEVDGDIRNTAGQSIAGSVQEAYIMPGNGNAAGNYAVHRVVPKPTCPAGMNPQIFVGTSITFAHDTGKPIIGVLPWAESISASEWRVYLRVRNTDDWYYPSAEYGQMLVLTKCT